MKTKLKENKTPVTGGYLKSMFLLLFCFTAFQVSAQEDQQKERIVYDMAEKMPEFPGGPAAMFKYINDNIKDMDEQDRSRGRVVVQFVVNADGKISDISIKSGASPALDKEAIRLVEEMPDWTPGSIKGEAVNVNYTIPVMFRLK